jgi:hypothetical protein
MVLNARSIVNASMIAVSARNASPRPVRRAALSENCDSSTVTMRAAACGTKFTTRKSRSASDTEAKTGNAVTTVSATVTSGTRASRVVNVRLPATWMQRSSRKRRTTSPRNAHSAATVVNARPSARRSRVLIGTPVTFPDDLLGTRAMLRGWNAFPAGRSRANEGKFRFRHAGPAMHTQMPREVARRRHRGLR